MAARGSKLIMSAEKGELVEAVMPSVLSGPPETMVGSLYGENGV